MKKTIFFTGITLMLLIPSVSSTTVLFFGDTQISHNEGHTRDFPGNTTNVFENVTDIISKNYDYQYAWALGDLVSPGGVESNEEMDEVWKAWWNNWAKVESKTYNMGFNCLIGNHDNCYGINNNYRNVPLFYSYLVGNILFIVLSDLDTPSDNIGESSGTGTLIYNNINEIEYCNDMVRSNQDKNIMILTHQATKGTTQNSDCCSNYISNPEWDAMFQKFEEDGIHVNAHIHGHTHCGYPDDLLIMEKYGVTFIDASAAGSGSCDESQQWTGHVMFMNLTEGINTANLDMLDITNYEEETKWVDWSDTYGSRTYPSILNLTYEYKDKPEQIYYDDYEDVGTTKNEAVIGFILGFVPMLLILVFVLRGKK